MIISTNSSLLFNIYLII